MSVNPAKKTALRRLRRDLLELQRADILSIAAHPLDDNPFEWHVNIKPTDGVYSGVYFHLIMIFPHPSMPPKVKICTPIRHPNIFNDWLCLSMIRPHTSTVPYEGWSRAYSATSICLQLQSFLFAEKIDQDGGYQANARLSDQDVKKSLNICRTFKCSKCNHSHSTPWPMVKGPPEALIKVFPTSNDGHVVVQGSACQTTHTYWVGAYGEFGVNYGKVMYEAFINWTGDKWKKNNIRGGLCRFGFGSECAQVCGRDEHSFGYGGTGMYSYANSFDKFGQSFSKDDTITVAVDFNTSRIYFAKNGQLMEPKRSIWLPNYLHGALLFPILSFKNSRAEFNFGTPKKPCKWLVKNGFKTLEEMALEQGSFGGEKEENTFNDDEKSVDWFDEHIIDDMWLSIFVSLQVPEIFSAQFVCKKWNALIKKFNIMERNEIYCYFTKAKMGQAKGGRIMGIAFDVRPNENGFGVNIKSQMDILSYAAWTQGCRFGVWGEKLTHFLPLAMNKQHAEIAHKQIIGSLNALCKAVYTPQRGQYNEIEKRIINSQSLREVDTLITMMNQIVVQFVMDNQNNKEVSMVMCEKVVLGYCALHHLLLLLKSKNNKVIAPFANKVVNSFLTKGGTNKNACRDLGKFLIYVMLSKYSWCDVAKLFIEEVFTRNVRWMVADKKYSKFNTTKTVPNRLKETFTASKISRRLVMFQVWFMKNTTSQTLKGYNQRLGRPDIKVKNGVVAKTKFILNSQSWRDYFNELDVVLKDDNTIDRLLRFAIYNSKFKGYHRDRGVIQTVKAPTIKVNGAKSNKQQLQQQNEVQNENVSVGISAGKGRGWGSGWRGRGRGNFTAQRGRGRGRGFQPRDASNVRGSGPKPYNSQRQNSKMSNGTSNGHVQMQQPGMPQQNVQPGQQPVRRPAQSNGSTPMKNNQNVNNVQNNNANGQKKLSKSQRARLRKRLAKERASQQQ